MAFMRYKEYVMYASLSFLTVLLLKIKDFRDVIVSFGMFK